MVTAILLATACGRAAASERAAASAGIGAWTIEATLVTPRGRAVEPVFKEEELRRIVRPLLDSGCNEPVIREALDRRYKFLGYVPAIAVECSGQTLRLRVRESSHTIDLITFDPGDLARIGVKPDQEFEDKVRFYPVPNDAPRAVLRALLLTREGDLYNFERYRADREALARLGYTVAFIPGSAEGDDEYPRGAYLVMSLTPRSPTAEDRRKTNYIGGTASYAPRAKGAAGMLYEKDGLFGEFDRLSVAPTYSTAAGGSVSYSAPLLARRASPARIYDLEFRIYSDFQNNRQLETVETDQRQSGLSGTVGIRPLGLRPPHTLKIDLGLKSERIVLDQAPPGEEDGATDSIRIAATYDWRHADRWPSLSWHLAPSVDWVLRARGGEVTFVRPGLESMLHIRSRSGVEINLHAVGGTIDREVPSFELWSLGGPTTVRGFKEDSFLGRNLAAFQTEIWLPFVRPLAATAPPEGEPWDAARAPYEPRAARLFKWALFADAGYLSGTTAGTTESIAGAGVGIRFLVPHHPFVVKVDYGWGLGARGGEAFPYVWLAYRY